MDNHSPLPRFQFRENMPSLWDMARQGVSDTARVIPKAILQEAALQLPGYGAPLVVADPELAKDVLNDRSERFTRDRFMRRLLRRSWGKGLAGAEGEDWQRQRRAAAPAFRPQAVVENLAAFAHSAGRVAENLPTNAPIELNATIAKIIADIVFSVLVKTDGTVDTDAVARDVPGFVRKITNFSAVDLLPLPEAVFDWISGIGRDPAVVRLRKLADDIAHNRAHTKQTGDMIALLEGVGPIRDNIGGLFPAAMDTTVTGASWTLYTLALRPEWQAKVAAEARACDGHYTLDRLAITRRVVQEVLRLYPPAPLLVRTANQSTDLGGFSVRRGQPVAISIYAMHRHTQLWENPDAFDPDRFLADPSAQRAYMPFGTGPRMCIAAQFALAEITIVTARLMAEFQFSTAAPDPVVTLNVATRSSTGLNVTAVRR